jgi:hypothetical protein
MQYCVYANTEVVMDKCLNQLQLQCGECGIVSNNSIVQGSSTKTTGKCEVLMDRYSQGQAHPHRANTNAFQTNSIGTSLANAALIRFQPSQSPKVNEVLAVNTSYTTNETIDLCKHPLTPTGTAVTSTPSQPESRPKHQTKSWQEISAQINAFAEDNMKKVGYSYPTKKAAPQGDPILISILKRDPAEFHSAKDAFKKSLESQSALVKWDQRMGLKRCHSRMMTKSAGSRKKLLDTMSLALDGDDNDDQRQHKKAKFGVAACSA